MYAPSHAMHSGTHSRINSRSAKLKAMHLSLMSCISVVSTIRERQDDCKSTLCCRLLLALAFAVAIELGGLAETGVLFSSLAPPTVGVLCLASL